MARVLGTNEAVLRIHGVNDSVYTTRKGRAAWRRVQAALGGRSVEVSSPLCDSLNAIADRENLIIKVDTSDARPDSTP